MGNWPGKLKQWKWAQKLMARAGFEPVTSGLQAQCSTNWTKLQINFYIMINIYSTLVKMTFIGNLDIFKSSKYLNKGQMSNTKLKSSFSQSSSLIPQTYETWNR